MTTNQTIDGVPRELLDRLQIALSNSYCPERFLLNELRALLDAPAKPVPSCVGELERFESDGEAFVKVGDVIDMLGNLKAAQSQGEPVAWLAQAIGKDGEVYRSNASTTETTMRDVGFAWGQGVIDRFTIVIKPLYAVQPAPAGHTMKTVMTAICSIDGFPMLTSNQCHALAMELNACLDEVARLNGGL